MWNYALYGAIGSLIGELGKTKGVMFLPRLVRIDGRLGIDWGFVSTLGIGAFVGIVVDHNPILSGLGGYAGIKMIDYFMHQLFPDYVSNYISKRKEAADED
jgi:hypothetical protein